MIDRTAISRAIRNLRDGPRAPAGRAWTPVALRDGREVLEEGPAGALPGPGGWSDLARPGDEAPLWLAHVGGAAYLPRMGAVVDAGGALHRATVNEAAQYDPRFSSFPYLKWREGGLSFAPPARAPRLGAATVWLPFHATYNYGHFVLDAMTSLLAAEEAGGLVMAPPIAPPLKPWQAELLALAFGPDLRLRTVREHAVQLEAAVYASSLDNFLHAPTSIVARLRARLLAGTPRGGAAGPRRVYFSRRGWSMRVMLNEAELEDALRARGFTIVHPERLSIAEQIGLVRDAQVLVAPTGAALTNGLFAPAQARLIEIQPVGFGDAWVAAYRRVVGGDCTVFRVPDAVAVKDVPLRHRRRLGFRFAYRLPLESFLAQVDVRL